MGSPYATPRDVSSLAECHFYHTTDVPGHGLVEGEWDLRAGASKYLGDADLRGRRVLEMGTASGFLCFHMERAGAEVVGFDLDADQSWDVVPYAGDDLARYAAERRAHVERIKNAWWLCHAAFRSKAKAVYGTAYSVPEAIGPVDVVTFGSILLHLRDPFRALESALRLATHAAIVTEVLPRGHVPLSRVRRALARLPFHSWRKTGRRLPTATMEFMPDALKRGPKETWWHLSPEAVVRMLAVLGFPDSRVSFHVQRYRQWEVDLFTVVANRKPGG